LCLAFIAALAVPALAEGDATLVYDTEDWHLEVRVVLGTQADLELSGRQIQLYTDEVERLIHHRPQNVARFTWRWSLGGGPVSGATASGVETLFPNESWRLVDPAARSYRESIVTQGLCFGPHEVTHVLTWGTFWLGWDNEGFATFTDWLYASASWRYGQPTQLRHDCDATGWSDGVMRHPYSDLRRFDRSYNAYATGACFWLEVYRRGGFPAIRRILMRLRAYEPRSPGELVTHHVNPVLRLDFRPLARRYGFSDADLTAEGPVPPDPPPPSTALSRPKPVAPPRAGRVLTVSAAVTRGDTGDPPSTATVSCAARVGRTTLSPSARRFTNARAACSWRLPHSARGRALQATMTASVRGVAATARYAAAVR